MLSNLAGIHVALLPVIPKYHVKEHPKTTAQKVQQILNQEVQTKVFELLFRPLDQPFNPGMLMVCGDSWMW